MDHGWDLSWSLQDAPLGWEMSFVPALQTGYTTQYLDAEEEEQMELFGFLENLSPNVEIDQTGVIREK